jgi:hypothetical protein
MTTDEEIKARIAELKERRNIVLEQRRCYGESGFRRSRLTDSLLVEANQIDAQIAELSRLLKKEQ